MTNGRVDTALTERIVDLEISLSGLQARFAILEEKLKELASDERVAKPAGD